MSSPVNFERADSYNSPLHYLTQVKPGEPLAAVQARTAAPLSYTKRAGPVEESTSSSALERLPASSATTTAVNLNPLARAKNLTAGSFRENAEAHIKSGSNAVAAYAKASLNSAAKWLFMSAAAAHITITLGSGIAAGATALAMVGGPASPIGALAAGIGGFAGLAIGGIAASITTGVLGLLAGGLMAMTEPPGKNWQETSKMLKESFVLPTLLSFHLMTAGMFSKNDV